MVWALSSSTAARWVSCTARMSKARAATADTLAGVQWDMFQEPMRRRGGWVGAAEGGEGPPREPSQVMAPGTRRGRSPRNLAIVRGAHITWMEAEVYSIRHHLILVKHLLRAPIRVGVGPHW